MPDLPEQLRAADVNPLVVKPLATAHSVEALTASRRDLSLVAEEATVQATPPPERTYGALIGAGEEAHLGEARVMRPDTWWCRPVLMPQLRLDVLTDAVVFGGTIRSRTRGRHEGGQLLLTREGHLHPASFSIMDGEGTLPADLVSGVSLDEPFAFVGDHQVERLEGEYFFLGSLHRHFGHFLLEGTARLWAEDVLPGVRAERRYLIYEEALPDWLSEFLSLASIRPSQLTTAPACARVERLIVPSATIRTHRWMRHLQADVWRRIAEGVPRPSAGPENVYLSRRNVKQRALINEEEVEAAFVRAGYTVIAPEALSVREQVALARGARRLGGCVGSQMYLAAFQEPGARNTLIAPRNFFLKDDCLIADALDHHLAVAFGSRVDFSQGPVDRTWSCELSAIEKALAG